MGYVFEGIQVGLVLALLVGPLLLVLIQASLERGTLAGLAAALGIWISDFLFIAVVYYGLSQLERLVKWSGFEVTLGTAGALLLIGFGIGTLLSARKALDRPAGRLLTSRAGYGKLFVKGFLVNTVNPFTVFFWISISGAMVIKRDLPASDAYLFYAGILGTILVTDTAKIVAARFIRNRLRPVHFMWVRRVAGLALLVFGIVLFIRVVM